MNDVINQLNPNINIASAAPNIYFFALAIHSSSDVNNINPNPYINTTSAISAANDRATLITNAMKLVAPLVSHVSGLVPDANLSSHIMPNNLCTKPCGSSIISSCSVPVIDVVGIPVVSTS